MEQVTIKGITYNVVAESPFTGNALAASNGYYVSIIMLKRPKGNKEFWATRSKDGDITLN